MNKKNHTVTIPFEDYEKLITLSEKKEAESTLIQDHLNFLAEDCSIFIRNFNPTQKPVSVFKQPGMIGVEIIFKY